jgi:predicted amidophosphoribosyltransferase
MIKFSDEQLLRIAAAKRANGELEECRGLLQKVTKSAMPPDLLSEVTYELAKKRSALGELESARQLFADCTQRHPNKIVRALCNERCSLINSIAAGRTPGASQLRPLWDNAQVEQARRMKPDLLAPAIAYIGCPAAYRSGFDPQRSDPLSQLLRLIKNGVEEAVIRKLGRYLAAYVFHATPMLFTVDFVIPVPTQPERMTLRGYSIPRILAEEVSKACAVPLHDEFVRAAGTGVELRKVPRWYRSFAADGAFVISEKEEWLRGRVALIVDDILTTGATVREVAKMLTQFGTQAICVAALAHTESGRFG